MKPRCPRCGTFWLAVWPEEEEGWRYGCCLCGYEWTEIHVPKARVSKLPLTPDEVFGVVLYACVMSAVLLFMLLDLYQAL